MRVFNINSQDYYLWNNWSNTYVKILKEECFSLERYLLYFNPDYFIINNSDSAFKKVPEENEKYSLQGLTIQDLNELGLRYPLLIKTYDDTEEDPAIISWTSGTEKPTNPAENSGFYDTNTSIFYIYRNKEWTSSLYVNGALYLPQKLGFKQGIKNLDLNAYLWWYPNFDIIDKSHWITDQNDNPIAFYFDKKLLDRFYLKHYLITIEQELNNSIEQYKIFNTDFPSAKEFEESIANKEYAETQYGELNSTPDKLDYDIWRASFVTNNNNTFYFYPTYDALSTFPEGTVLICKAQELNGLNNSDSLSHYIPSNYNIFAQGSYALHTLSLNSTDLISTYTEQGVSQLGTQFYFTLDFYNNRYILNNETLWDWQDTIGISLLAGKWSNEQTIIPTEKNIVNLNNNLWDGGNPLFVSLKTKKAENNKFIYDTFYSDTIFYNSFTKIANKTVATYSMTDNILSNKDRQGFISKDVDIESLSLPLIFIELF